MRERPDDAVDVCRRPRPASPRPHRVHDGGHRRRRRGARSRRAVSRASGAGWVVERADVASAESAVLLRDYFVDVSDRWFRLHEDRDSTPEEIEQSLAADAERRPRAADRCLRRRPRPANGSSAASECGSCPTGPTSPSCKRMYVRPEVRGSGLAAALLAAAEEAARDWVRRRSGSTPGSTSSRPGRCTCATASSRCRPSTRATTPRSGTPSGWPHRDATARPAECPPDSAASDGPVSRQPRTMRRPLAEGRRPGEVVEILRHQAPEISTTRRREIVRPREVSGRRRWCGGARRAGCRRHRARPS